MAGAGLALTLLAGPGLAFARPAAERVVETEIARGSDCPWIEAGTEAGYLCGCEAVSVTVTEEPVSVAEWEDGAPADEEYGGDGGSGSSGGSSGGSSSGGEGGSTGGTSSGASSSGAGGSSGSTGSTGSASSAGGSSGSTGSASGGSGGGYDSGGGLSWLTWVLPWLLILSGVLVLAALLAALLRSRRRPLAASGPASYGSGDPLPYGPPPPDPGPPPPDYGQEPPDADWGYVPDKDRY